MPEFKRAEEVEQLCFQMRLSDFPRGLSRSRINNLFNGLAPYSDQEVSENEINVNVNFLEPTVLGHDSRAQFYSAFLKPGNYFTMRTDMPPVHERESVSKKVTKNLNRILKDSLPYFECFRSTFASDVLHGVGPTGYKDGDCLIPDPFGMEDVLIPARTYLTMSNLPFFALYRSLSAVELIKLTRGPNLDPGWNMPVVDACLEWIDKETMQLIGSNWPEVWAPEKAAERVKGDGGFYVGDQAPTIDCFDFYYYDEGSKESGWKRKMILDSWATPEAAGAKATMTKKSGDIYGRYQGQFLYNPDRVFAESWQNIVNFQFADLSAVGPFQYHSVRSLGFLLFAVCHLQNRMRCKFSESVFEALMMLFRVKTMDDVQRALKLNLINKGFIDDTIVPLTAQERYQVNTALVELGIQQNQNIIDRNSSSYVQNQNYSQDRTEKTKFQVMAELNATTSLTSIGLTQAYTYQKFQYQEQKRRAMKRDSNDPLVKKFRSACLKDGVDDKYLVAEAWEVEPERVMGAGNKTLEMAIAQQLMEWRDKLDPEPQRVVLRDAIMAVTDDPAKAEFLVPENPVAITDSVHDAQLAAGVLMQGLPVGIKTGMNHLEYVEALLVDMAVIVQQGNQQGGMVSPEKLAGLQNVAHHIAAHIEIIAQDKQAEEKAKEFGKQLSDLMNQVKAFAQRMAQAQKAQQQKGAGENGQADAAKIQAMILSAKVKAQNAKESHAQRTAQRQIQWEQQMKQDQQRFQFELQKDAAQTQQELTHNAAKTGQEIQLNRLKSMSQPKPNSE